MSIHYIVQFEKHGSIRPSAGVLPFEVWLDVGNALEMGCIDHHQTKGYPSALDALLGNLSYLSNLKKSAQEGKSITVHLHSYPDLDCLSCYYVVKYYLEHDEESFLAMFGPKGKVAAYREYINTIDAGRGKETRYPTLYALFCSINAIGEDNYETHSRIAAQGLSLIDSAIMHLAKNPDMDLFTYDMTEYVDSAWGIDFEIFHAYEGEKERGDIRFEKIPLWKKDGTLDEGAMSAIWLKLPVDGNGYNNARKEGCFLTVVPFHIKGEVSKFGAQVVSQTTTVTVSLDPEQDPEYAYSLKPMAEVLEQLEQMAELQVYEQTGSFVRDHSRARASEGPFSMKPFSVTGNPWYISGSEDQVASPRGGSLLAYEDILAIIRNNGCLVKNAYMLSVFEEEDVKVLYDAHTVSISKWQSDVKEKLHADNGYKILLAEVDASLICHSNRILEAYCMSVVDRSLDECTDDEIYFVDYRTCIYEDLNCMIILLATSGEQDYKSMAISKIMDKDTVEQFRDSRLTRQLMKLPIWRHQLITYGRKLGFGDVRKRRSLEEINDALLQLSAEIQSESMISSNLLSSIYSFAKKQMNIEDMKNEVMEEAQILVNESRERLVSTFNIIMAIATPLALMDMLFESGVFQIPPIITVPEGYGGLGWGVTAVICLLLILIMMGLSNRRRSKRRGKRKDKKDNKKE